MQDMKDFYQKVLQFIQHLIQLLNNQSKMHLSRIYYANDKMQAALTVLDTKTGGIVAIGGGRNFSTGY